MAWNICSIVATSLLALATNAAVVTSPSEIWTVVGDRQYTVEWESIAHNRELEGDKEVAIELYYCGAHCHKDDCGHPIADLCESNPEDCASADGAVQVVMPDPMFGTSWGYKVRVTDGADDGGEDGGDCSEEFRLMASEEAPARGGDGTPFLDVLSPLEGDFAVAGERYTVQFNYDSGVSSKDDRFTIDMYMSGAGSNGGCGIWVGSLCDEPSIGCKDTDDGVYDVFIPEMAEPGFYSIRVGRFGYQSLFDCSGQFELIQPAAPLAS